MKAYARVALCLLAAGSLALGACGGGGDDLTPPGPSEKVLQPVSLAGISCGWGGEGEALGPSSVRVAPIMVCVAHFDLSQVPADWSTALLEVPLRCLQPELPDGTLHVFCFAGDGECSIDEGSAGGPIGTETGLAGEYPTVLLDVTTQVENYIGSSATHIALRFVSPPGSDDYDLGSAGGVPAPTITIEP